MITGHLRQSLAFINKVRFESPSVNIHRGLAATAALVGVACQFGDSLGYSNRNTPFKLHVLFGLALLSAILARFLWELRRTPLSPAIDIHAFNRQLKRQVYLLIYGLAGVKELVDIAVYIWCGGVFAVGGVDIGRHIRNDSTMLPPFGEFKSYVVYGVASIFLIRVLIIMYGPSLTRRRLERYDRRQRIARQ